MSAEVIPLTMPVTINGYPEELRIFNSQILEIQEPEITDKSNILYRLTPRANQVFQKLVNM